MDKILDAINKINWRIQDLVDRMRRDGRMRVVAILLSASVVAIIGLYVLLPRAQEQNNTGSGVRQGNGTARNYPVAEVPDLRQTNNYPEDAEMSETAAPENSGESGKNNNQWTVYSSATDGITAAFPQAPSRATGDIIGAETEYAELALLDVGNVTLVSSDMGHSYIVSAQDIYSLPAGITPNIMLDSMAESLETGESGTRLTIGGYPALDVTGWDEETGSYLHTRTLAMPSRLVTISVNTYDATQPDYFDFFAGSVQVTP